MIQYKSNPKEQIPKVKLGVSEQDTEGFLICEDCRHNTLTYEPSRDGACFCGCH